MLCPIPAGKSGSKWLDRLRSSKGISTGAGLDLDQFLKQTSPEVSNSPHTETSFADINPKLDTSNSAELICEPVIDAKQTANASRSVNGDEWFGVVSDVLAELFCMGDSNGGGASIRDAKRNCRKQPNPRICVLPAPTAVRNDIENPRRRNDDSVTSRLNCDDNFVERKRTTKSLRVLTREESVDVEDDDKSPTDLSGFSRTEVTVIDTSCEAWKCEKLLFRKKNFWRVRDSKRKNRNFAKKKRKANMAELENSGREKKMQACSSSKEGDGEQIVVPIHMNIKGVSK